MKLLAVDIGNTKIKLALMDIKSAQVEHKITFSTEKKLAEKEYREKIISVLQKELLNKITSIKEIKDIFLISVVPEINKTIINVLEKIIQCKVILFNPKEMLKINANECGHDNIMLTLAGINRNNNFLLVSMGTANVFITVINQEPKGVVITPGLEISKRALIEKTSLIKDFKDYDYKGVFTIGNTQQCVSSGLILSQIGTIEKIAKEVQAKTQKKISVFFTGGSFSHIQKQINLNEKYEYLPNLLFEGMHLVYQIVKGGLWKKIKIKFNLILKKYVN